jgi:phage terminase large subunit GpA-like protein
LYSVGTDSAKDTLFSRLGLQKFGPGYCHHPDTFAYDELYFDQLSSEEKFNKYDKGVLMGTYYKKTKSRNEALDLKILNMAAYAILNPNLVALAATMFASVPKPVEPVVEPPVVEPLNAPPAVPQPANVPPRRRGRGFASRW